MSESTVEPSDESAGTATDDAAVVDAGGTGEEPTVAEPTEEPNTEDTNAAGPEVTSEAEAGTEGAGPVDGAEPLVPSNDGEGETAYVAPSEDEGETAFKE